MANNQNPVKHHIDHYQGHRYGHLDKSKDDADVCIVGAGAAGGVIAYELSKAGFKVVMM